MTVGARFGSELQMQAATDFVWAFFPLDFAAPAELLPTPTNLLLELLATLVDFLSNVVAVRCYEVHQSSTTTALAPFANIRTSKSKRQRQHKRSVACLVEQKCRKIDSILHLMGQYVLACRKK